MPFVGGNALPYEIIRRPPPAGEDPTSALGSSREYNMAQIRVLLSDDPTEFQNGTGYSDPDNIRLANITTAQATATGATSTNPYGIAMTAGNYPSSFAAGTYQLYFAAASNAVPSAGPVSGSSTANLNGTDNILDWPSAPAAWYGNAKNTSPTLQGLQPTGPVGGPGAPILTGSSASLAPLLTLCPPTNPKYGDPAGCPATPAPPYYVVNNAAPTVVNNGTATWNLIDGYLRVEYKDASGAWNPVTREWLGLGFARGVTPPTHPRQQPNQSERDSAAARAGGSQHGNLGCAPRIFAANCKHRDCPELHEQKAAASARRGPPRRPFWKTRGPRSGRLAPRLRHRASLPSTGIPSTSTMPAKVSLGM